MAMPPGPKAEGHLFGYCYPSRIRMKNMMTTPTPNRWSVRSLTFISGKYAESALGVVEHTADTSAFDFALCFE